MTLSNVKLILAREIRDQLRDRRTLFMIAVLPILLYPLLGMSMFQISQFMQEQPTRVCYFTEAPEPVEIQGGHVTRRVLCKDLAIPPRLYDC